MYNPSIWDAELTSGRQDYIASILINSNGGANMHLLGRTLDRVARENNPMPETAEGFHNTRFRRILSRDIDAMNRNPKYRFIIASAKDGVKIADKTDAMQMIDVLRKTALRKLAKASIMARKAGLDCQLAISGEEIKTFLEDDDE
jgi:hypothetical protein